MTDKLWRVTLIKRDGTGLTDEFYRRCAASIMAWLAILLRVAEFAWVTDILTGKVYRTYQRPK
jgi:hypothetical protein